MLCQVTHSPEARREAPRPPPNPSGRPCGPLGIGTSHGQFTLFGLALNRKSGEEITVADINRELAGVDGRPRVPHGVFS